MSPEHGCDRPVGLDIDDSGRLWRFFAFHKVYIRLMTALVLTEAVQMMCPVGSYGIENNFINE
ncbi:hypothetical protein KUTeg_023489 [Tegillarca granosa]|uniref:Uncharacterized protein n=1 Tax=Tegillarca granosa TaxID=220873 RepID=A0ABQ9E586_TEGGR|nr:hypothetical protein KUTeg_023489 [Tegillarca granosa]